MEAICLTHMAPISRPKCVGPDARAMPALNGPGSLDTVTVHILTATCQPNAGDWLCEHLLTGEVLARNVYRP